MQFNSFYYAFSSFYSIQMYFLIVNECLDISSRNRQSIINNYNYIACHSAYQDGSIFEPPILGILFRLFAKVRQAPILGESLRSVPSRVPLCFSYSVSYRRRRNRVEGAWSVHPLLHIASCIWLKPKPSQVLRQAPFNYQNSPEKGNLV